MKDAMEEEKTQDPAAAPAEGAGPPSGAAAEGEARDEGRGGRAGAGAGGAGPGGDEADVERIKPVLEALIFASDRPVSLERLVSVMEGEERAAVRAALDSLVDDYAAGRGFTLEEAAGGWRFRTRVEYAPWIRRLFKAGPKKMSRAAMETLAVIAYKQPVTRAEIEEVRGVDTGGVLKTLLERRLVRVVGRKDLPGRPAVYGTTRQFLETFALKDLGALPSLKEAALPEETAEEFEEEHERETSEDTGRGGGGVEEEGRGDDPRGEGQGLGPGGDRAGHEG